MIPPELNMMKLSLPRVMNIPHKLLGLSLAVYFLSFSIAAQNNPINQPGSPSDSADVIRVTTKLIQLDALAIDRAGKQVTDLTANDFEVFQDGKPQRITNFSYVRTEAKGKGSRTISGENSSDLKTVDTRPNPLGRIVTFVVDTGSCAASKIGVRAAREGLERFVNEQMRPNDLVAIYQTVAGHSLTQHYTSDKALLRLIISRISWSSSAVCDSRGGDLFEREKADHTLKASGTGRKSFESPEDRQARESFEDSNRNNRTVGVIESLRIITRRLQTVGGRKVIFLLSDGLPVIGRDGREGRSQDLLRNLIAEANRSAITFNSIDVRGQFNAALLHAEDEVLPEQPNVANPTSTDKAIINRIAEARRLQDGLAVLANETGGSFSRGRNRVDHSIRDLLNLEEGFYLLAYQPDDDSFKGSQFHKIELRLKRSDLRLLSRSGLPGTREATRPKVGSVHGEVLEALNLPIPRTEIGVRLNAFFSNAVPGTPIKVGSFVYSTVWFNARDLNFVDEGNAHKRALLDVAVVLFDEKGKVAGSVNRTHTIRVAPQDLATVREKGLNYPVHFPVRNAGLYILRVVVRDASNKQIGSASQGLEVPNLKDGELFLPVLTLSAVDHDLNVISPFSVRSEDGSSTATTSVSPKFRGGEVIAYTYSLYNAHRDQRGSSPKLSVQVTLFHNGRILFDEEQQSPPFGTKMDSPRVDSGGYVKLSPNLENGEYILRIRISDLISGKSIEKLADFELTGTK